MRKFLAILMVAVLVAGLAMAEGASFDAVGDWSMDYFGIPMIFSFLDDGTFAAVIDMDIPVADDGSNGFTGLWVAEGDTLTISDDTGVSEETFTFTWDGEKLAGVMEETDVYLYPVE